MPEFHVILETIRTGTAAMLVSADDEAAARELARAECAAGHAHCPVEWCTDNVETTVVQVRDASGTGDRQ